MEEVLAWLNSNSGAVSAVATVVAAVIAALALRSAASDSRERSRPMVAAEFRIAPNSNDSIELVVTNYGPTPAERLDVSFAPGIPDDFDTSPVLRRYEKTIPSLNPGQTLTNLWLRPKFGTSGVYEGNQFSFPDECSVTMSYRSGRRKFQHVSELDVNVMMHQSAVVSTDSFLGSIQGINKSLAQLSLSAQEVAAPK